MNSIFLPTTKQLLIDIECKWLLINLLNYLLQLPLFNNFQNRFKFFTFVVLRWSGFGAAYLARSPLRSAQVGFRLAPLCFPLRSHSTHMLRCSVVYSSRNYSLAAALSINSTVLMLHRKWRNYLE